MSDPLYSGNIFFNNLTIKSEPMAIDSGGGPNPSSASVPIPSRRTLELSDIRAEGFGDFAAASPCDSSYLDVNLTGSSLYLSGSVWSPRSDIKMEDDDIFQVDKNDLIQGPTLAELNANDDTLLDDLTFDDLMLPEESFIQAVPLSRGISPLLFPEQQLTSTAPVALSFPPDGGFYRDFNTAVRPRCELSPASHHSSESSSALQTVSPPPAASGGAYSPIPPGKPTTLHELLLKNSLSPTPQQTLGQSVPGRFNGTSVSVGSSGESTASSSGANKRSHQGSRLSSSAPTHLGLDQIWARREPRQHLLSTGSMAEATSTSSIATSGVLSPDGHDFSLEDCFDSEDDSDHEEDYSSGGDDSNSENDTGSTSNKSAKRERFFWQYNVQSKGPKGQRLVLKTKQEDPHRLNEVTDPVFSPQCSVQGIKHSGKARKGDGNDLTPNPRKLLVIGKELDKLNKTINEMTPVSELPYNARSDTRKEKNKLASRACRLKKKAQHEANKIKLHGLECEHKRLMNGLNQMKNAVVLRVSDNPPDPTDTTSIDKIVKSATRLKIAGQTTEFVNKVLEKMKQGVANGGLDDMHSQHFHQTSNN